MRITSGISSPTSTPTASTIAYSAKRNDGAASACSVNSAAGIRPPSTPTSNSMRRKCAINCRSKNRDRYEPMPIANKYVPMTVEN